MKKILTLTCLLVVSLVFGQNSLLWKIEGKDLSKPSYLFGTVHMICKDNFKMQDKLVDAIKNTDQAYFEIDMGNPNFLMQMQSNMLGEKTISSQISKEDSIFIDQKVKNVLGVGLANVDQLKPLIIMSIVMQKSFPCEITSLEDEIIKRFRQDDKLMGGLSTVKDQYNYLDRFIDAKELVTMIKSIESEEMTSTFNKIYELYQNEDIKGLDQEMVKYSSSNSELYEVLMVERNKIWSDKIPSIIKEKSTLIAVGSGHLSGEKGLINLLKNQGYKVTPVF